jgi:pimeloyl-ACP methyl ester carboxylesterase
MPVAHLNGIDINYEVQRSGTPLVLTHGYSASLEMWREQVAPLSAKYRLVIYDSRGHGKTTAPADMDQYGLARDYVADKLALMDHLGIEKAYVGGLSMGGMIAQEFALQHPDRVKALLLFDTGPGMGALAQDASRISQFTRMREMMQTLARTKGMAAIIEGMRNSPMALSAAATGRAIPDAAGTDEHAARAGGDESVRRGARRIGVRADRFGGGQRDRGGDAAGRSHHGHDRHAGALPGARAGYAPRRRRPRRARRQRDRDRAGRREGRSRPQRRDGDGDVPSGEAGSAAAPERGLSGAGRQRMERGSSV